MDHKVGIWIDHKRAVIVETSANGVTTRTLESSVDAHPRYAGPQDGGGEKKYEQRHAEQLDRYYDDVLSHVGRHQAMFLFGPGEAKRELKTRLKSSPSAADSTVDLETADKLTDPQIVAKVKEHFGL